MKKQHALRNLLAALVVTAGCTLMAPTTVQAQGNENSAASAFVQSLHDNYWRWLYGNITLPSDANGNAVSGGIAMLALPNAPGDGTPGSINLTLSAGEPFFLPLFGEIGTSYTDGTPPDDFLNLDIYRTLDIKFTIDGKTLVTTQNVMNYYAQGLFNPPMPFQVANLDSLIWFQSVGVLHAPLSVGTHVMKLDVRNTIPAFGAFGEFHNTFNITVLPRNR